MNILQIANKAIFPPDGGSLAILSLAKGYIQNGNKVHLLNMTTHKHKNNMDIIESKYHDDLKITGIDVNIHISFLRLFLNLFFSSEPYIAQRFYNKKFSSELKRIINENTFDFVQIEGLYVLQYIHVIRKVFRGKIIYRPHNVEFLIWQRNISETKSIFKKLYFQILYKRLKKMEIELLNSYDFILPISSSDANTYQNLGNYKPLLLTPFGIDTEKKEQFIELPNQDKNINYIGALDWIPNQEGLIWFIEKCFPIILKSCPETQLHIAGRNAPKWLIKKFIHPHIIFYGEVDHAYEFIQKPGPIIVPLFSGSGMRVKIIESMFLQKAIVATSIGAEGIDCTHEKHIMLADTSEVFSESVIKILNNPELQTLLGENAADLIRNQYNFEIISKNVLTFIKEYDCA